jgi:hypothetical protein
VIALTFTTTNLRSAREEFDTDDLGEAVADFARRHFKSGGLDAWVFALVVERDGVYLTRDEVADKLHELADSELSRAIDAHRREAASRPDGPARFSPSSGSRRAGPGAKREELLDRLVRESAEWGRRSARGLPARRNDRRTGAMKIVTHPSVQPGLIYAVGPCPCCGERRDCPRCAGSGIYAVKVAASTRIAGEQ